MPARPLIVAGAGRLGQALCAWLAAAGIPVAAVADRKLARARLGVRLARAQAALDWPGLLSRLRGSPPPLVLLAISDDALAGVARELAASRREWRGAAVLHASGAVSSAALAPLRARGAGVGAMHPMMTFAAGAAPSPQGVVFSLEGDAVALAEARKLVRALRGRELRLDAGAKAALHLAATVSGPGATVLMAAAEAHLRRAGFRGANLRAARAGLAALLEATAANLARMPSAAAFTGPWARGDRRTVARHRMLLAPGAEKRLYNALEAMARAELPPARPARPKKKN